MKGLDSSDAKKASRPWRWQAWTWRTRSPRTDCLMGTKTEIGWTRSLEDGTRRHVFAERHGRQWRFFERPKRKGREITWQLINEPPLDDWLELLEAMERR